MAQKQQALSQPQFIIKSADGKVFYLTVSVWAYEPGATGHSKPDVAAQQAAATQAVVNKFSQLAATPANNLVAVQVPVDDAHAYMAMIT
jgi:hypothetical protein